MHVFLKIIPQIRRYDHVSTLFSLAMYVSYPTLHVFVRKLT